VAVVILGVVVSFSFFSVMFLKVYSVRGIYIYSPQQGQLKKILSTK